MLSEKEIKELEKLANENRQNVIKMVHNAKSGHIGGSLSSADIMTVLFHKCMKNIPKCREDKNYNSRDRFVLSKGHVSPVYYSVLAQLGYIPKDELMTFRKLGTRLQGHPSLFCPGVEVCTGSLGQGLSIACGMAMALKLDKNPAHVFVLMGDGELQEGNVWEAFMQAPQRNLDNLTVIVDRNRLQIDGCIVNGLSEGCGTVVCQHGSLPVPVPAVLNIAEKYGIILRPTDNKGEMVTPTGIAIAAALKTSEKLTAAYRVRKTGIGLGKRDFGHANFLRAMIIEDVVDENQIYVIETNIDDSTAEELGLAMEKLLEDTLPVIFTSAAFVCPAVIFISSGCFF